jgi:two-component system sensor histidine kinase AlgZ
VSNDSRRALLDLPNSRHYHLPRLLTADRIGLYFVISGILSTIILVNVPNAGFEHFRHTILFTFFALLIFAVLISVIRRWLNRQSIWLATTVVAVVATAVLLGTHYSTQSFLSDELKQTVDLGRRVVFAAMLVGGFLRFNYVQQSLRRREESELHARIQALQSRIRPHFLFNSMNIIASLIPVDPDAAETVVEDLSELFRASLQEEGSEVSIEDELALCRRYMRIEHLRLGERLNIEWSIENAQDSVRIPLLTLQPLLENAIYRGIQPLPEGGTITVELSYATNDYTITVKNPVPSQDLSQPVGNKYPSPKGRGNRLAIQNIRSRLEVLYGKNAHLDAYESGDEFITRLTLPKTLTAR